MRRKLLPSLMICLTFFCTSSFAFTIASKWQASGPIIHTTYFITPGNDAVNVKGEVYVGTINSGTCIYANSYDMGEERVQTGDFIDYDALKVKSFLGISYNCMTVYYTVNQFVFETFALFFDGYNYYDTFPEYTELRLM